MERADDQEKVYRVWYIDNGKLDEVEEPLLDQFIRVTNEQQPVSIFARFWAFMLKILWVTKK